MRSVSHGGGFGLSRIESIMMHISVKERCPYRTAVPLAVKSAGQLLELIRELGGNKWNGRPDFLGCWCHRIFRRNSRAIHIRHRAGVRAAAVPAGATTETTTTGRRCSRRSEVEDLAARCLLFGEDEDRSSDRVEYFSQFSSAASASTAMLRWRKPSVRREARRCCGGVGEGSPRATAARSEGPH